VSSPAPIRSAANQHLQRLRAALVGKEPGVLVLEGERLVREGLRQRLAPELVLVSDDRRPLFAELARACPTVLVDGALLARFSDLASPPGIAALVRAPRESTIADIERSPRALVLVAAGVADAGNLGALARTAEAAGCAAIAVLRGGASPWSPKALRGSMGSLLRLPVVIAASGGELCAELARAGWQQAHAATRGGVDPARCAWRGPLALWLGAETGALPAPVAATPAVTIPMRGDAESLNVNAAAAVLLFAARAGLDSSGAAPEAAAPGHARAAKR
jgi:TrmH family RNA methyltransferase